MNKPLLSIITINYNNAEGLKKTMQSVKKQTSNNYEQIIIDGGSTDESINVINDFLADQIFSKKVAFWCSEKDNGVYDAMNKGISYAKGKYCLFLNSGDYFYNENVISKIELLKTDIDIYYGDAIFYNNKKEWVQKYPNKLTLGYFFRRTINHQNCLIKTSLQQNDLFDLNYKIISDRIFFINVIDKYDFLKIEHIDFYISKYESETGISTINQQKIVEELNDFLNKKFSKPIIEGFKYLWEAQLKLDLYENGYKGILKKIFSVLTTYTKIKEKLRLGR